MSLGGRLVPVLLLMLLLGLRRLRLLLTCR